MKMASPNYQERIEALRQTKMAHTRMKIAKNGFRNIDDHGYIPWDKPVDFTPKSNHPSGACYGITSIGENFKAWLEAHPVYIHPMSSLAGAWISTIPGVGRWRPEDRPTHLYPLHKHYNIIYHGIGAQNHLGPDMRIGLELGWGGLLQKIRQYRAMSRSADTAFYDGEEALVLGVQAWIRRHVEAARQMAAQETDDERRGNLLSIADMNAWLVDGTPRTLREACQFLAWFQCIDRMWCFGGALGQLDELLRPYYEADRAARCDDDKAVIWHIASLFYNDTHYSQIGGPAPAGHDLTSPISFLILEAAHRLKIPTNLAIRVHDGLDPALLRQAVTNLLEDGTGPCFSCAKGLDEGFQRNGVPIGLARMRAKVGCNWTALPGIEYCLQDVTRLCLVSPFLHAFHAMLADDNSPNTLETLWERYLEQLGVSVALIKEGFDWHMRHAAANTPEIVLNLFCHGPIERGLDAANGGVDLYNLTCDGVGLATVADSFAVIEQRVVQEQRITWDELAHCLATDYVDAEAIRLMMKNINRFGTGGSRADWWAQRLSGAYTGLIKGSPTPDGYHVIPGLFSHGEVVRLGEGLGATPNGRHAGAPISHGANPDPGFAHDWGFAPTAKANAVAMVQPGWGNSAPLQIDLDAKLLCDRGGVEAVEALIKAHNAQGGTLININVITREEILEAHADPERYPDLVVRVTGYSAFFRSLSYEYRQQIVDRLLAE